MKSKSSNMQPPAPKIATGITSQESEWFFFFIYSSTHYGAIFLRT